MSNEGKIDVPAVPQGWKLVPVEPTEAMSIAGGIAWESSLADDVIGPLEDAWAAMLAATPEQNQAQPAQCVPEGRRLFDESMGESLQAEAMALFDKAEHGHVKCPAYFLHELAFTIGRLRAALAATPAPAPAQGEPFGYFRAEPFGWTDCSEDAEGAIALYEHPAHEKHWTENEPVRLPSARTDRVYLAGPMTGIAELNFPAFNQEAERLRAEGLQVLNPADHGIVDGADWADYLRHDIAGLASCERIHLLRGWTKSKGACLEMTIAKALGMTVTYQVDAEMEHNNAHAQDQCNACCGTGRMVRDPDIGTDQECFVCDGTGFLPAQEPVTLTPAEIDHAVLEATGFDGFGTQPMNTHDTRNIGLEVIAALRAKGAV